MVVCNSKETSKGKNTKYIKSNKSSNVVNTSSVENKEKTTMEEKKPNPKPYGVLIGRKSRYLTPPFLLTFEIVNRNVHNYLFDLGVSSNVMSYSVCKKLSVEPQIWKKHIIKLDRSHVNILGELKDMSINLSSNSKVHQTINIIVVDIPKAYGLIFSGDWSAKLNGYFTID